MTSRDVSLAALLLVSAGWAQTDATPTFEVASVKPAAPFVPGGRGGRSGGVRTDPQMLAARNTTVKQLVIYAYRLAGYQVSGGPNWLDSEPYDIDARADRPSNDDRFRAMLQALLADRFHLKFHRETKEVGIYAMVLADKASAKFQPLKSGQSPSAGFVFRDLPSLAQMLSGSSDRPVLDRTGLKGEFDLKLDLKTAAEKWEREHAAAPADDNVGGVPENAIIAAARDQLGLILVPAKGPVELFVVDHVDKPNKN